jgi:two-component system, NtrC family, response regulator GlrR
MQPHADSPVPGSERTPTIPAPAWAKQVPTSGPFVLCCVHGTPSALVWTPNRPRSTIGSHSDNDLVVGDRTVSRFHCEIVVDESGVLVRDLLSKNGTRIDGIPVKEAYLRPGASLELGNVVFRVRMRDRATDPVAEGPARFGNLEAASPGMRALFAQLAAVASSDATVLLEGETGTGKTALAQALHIEGPRAERPFFVVDCGAIPANLLESELFGHERGSFTGATARRIGAFEAASGGTVFLDEIGEMPRELQPKILRVLESRSIRRVGSNEQIPVDVRVVAATNRSLRTEIDSGAFRADLYYRLAVVTLTVPPLRERPEDIPVLVRHMVGELRIDPMQATWLLSPMVLARLSRAPWPGNVRELRNHVERAALLAASDDRAADPSGPLRALPAAADPLDPDLPYADAKRAILDDFERRYVQALLEKHAGDVAAAARAAGVHRAHFYRLVARHRVER